MKVHSILLVTSLVISNGCLTAGYIIAGFWPIIPVLLAIFLFWLYVRRRSAFWSASILLLASVLLAAIGITIGLSLILMLVACSAALISWDLIQFNHRMVESSLHAADALVEKYHIQSLAFAASAGLLLALIGSSINLNLPFAVIVLLALTTVGGLIFGLQSMMRKDQ